jgi:thiaminase
MHTYIHAYIHTCIHAYMHTHILVYIHTDRHTDNPYSKWVATYLGKAGILRAHA